jgi:hypothetical protein
MSTQHDIALPLWSTTALGFSEDALPDDASALGKHLNHCKVAHGRLFAMRCVVDMLHGFVAGRFVTTLVVAFVLIGCYSLAV